MPRRTRGSAFLPAPAVRFGPIISPAHTNDLALTRNGGVFVVSPFLVRFLDKCDIFSKMVNQSETHKEQSATSGSPAGSRVTLSLAEVRAIALRSQGLADDLAPFGLGKDAVLKTIQHLGYVQVDTISVLQRAHHHVIWSRVPRLQTGHAA